MEVKPDWLRTDLPIKTLHLSCQNCGEKSTKPIYHPNCSGNCVLGVIQVKETIRPQLFEIIFKNEKTVMNWKPIFYCAGCGGRIGSVICEHCSQLHEIDKAVLIDPDGRSGITDELICATPGRSAKRIQPHNFREY